MANNYKNKLMLSIQLINVFIGILLTLIFTIIYINIESKELKITLLSLLVIFGIIIFTYLYIIMHKRNIKDSDIINTIELINEENEIIKKWSIADKVSFLIGKSNRENDVLIDLNSSIYSQFIEDNHAVLNYASGKWYIEDLSVESRVCIEKMKTEKNIELLRILLALLKKEILFLFLKLNYYLNRGEYIWH
ncbi:Putative membrane protein [Clostridium neonatale]|nr:Putative membrane protein [Clostridium neonatale]